MINPTLRLDRTLETPQTTNLYKMQWPHSSNEHRIQTIPHLNIVDINWILEPSWFTCATGVFILGVPNKLSHS